jgi:hypothetical protein
MKKRLFSDSRGEYSMRFKKAFTFLSTLLILSSMIGALPVTAAPLQQEDAPFIRQISSEITTSFPVGSLASGVTVQSPETWAQARAGVADPARQSIINQDPVNRMKSFDKGDDPLRPPRVEGSNVVGSNPGLFVSFEALNHRDQRLANNGNQFSIEPPDQGLCVGNGFVMETINDVIQVYDMAGNPLTEVISQNEFYRYPPAIDRTAGTFGPFVTDPSCLFDADTQRWFHVVLTLDVDEATGDFLGSNHLDIAVSKTSDPTKNWTIYRLPVQNNGDAGTPNHHCEGGPCIGDYPQIGADKYGFYVTTNEYEFFGPNFVSAQIYAFSKADLAANKKNVTVVQFDTKNKVQSGLGRQPGFTVWPAESPAGVFSTEAGGTEYFLSSNAAEEANAVLGGDFSDELIVWALTNTQSLATNSPDLKLRNTVLQSEVYGVPPLSEQKPGPIPLGQCINNKTLPTPFGRGCWQILFTEEPAHNEVLSRLDSGDSRIYQTWYADGKLWGALDTVVRVGNKREAGIAYFIVQPEITSAGNNVELQAEIVNQGYVAVAGNNVSYPAIAVLPNGMGIMAFTLVGQNYYPSAAYVHIDVNGTSDVHIAGEGLGPSDGFTSYKAFVGNPPRTRWGDYGAAVTDGTNIWFASEYIAQRCTFEEFTAGVSKDSLGDFGSCGGTRTALANWSTRISGVTP